jgi:hypothetical protein
LYTGVTEREESVVSCGRSPVAEVAARIDIEIVESGLAAIDLSLSKPGAVSGSGESRQAFRTNCQNSRAAGTCRVPYPEQIPLHFPRFCFPSAFMELAPPKPDRVSPKRKETIKTARIIEPSVGAGATPAQGAGDPGPSPCRDGGLV